jgi:protein-S-isoprenylcysteine O-methyltransferase Ste14
MPLSEHEQRILAEIEQQLAAEDPKFVARARRRRGWPARIQRRVAIVLGILGVIAVLMLAPLSAPWNIISASFGLTMVFLAIVLIATAKSDTEDQPSVGVPPDERT